MSYSSKIVKFNKVNFFPRKLLDKLKNYNLDNVLKLQ